MQQKICPIRIIENLGEVIAFYGEEGYKDNCNILYNSSEKEGIQHSYLAKDNDLVK